ncbi:MAG TPA: ABC-F family ATP-binding cassette domain-containing protein [Gaiellaceae bacterium]
MLSVRRVSKSYGPRSVLHDVSLVVPPRARIGLIGANGIGKSTLLRILAGLERPDEGEVTAPGLVGYLPQEPEAQPGETVWGYLGRRTGIAAAEAALTAREATLPEGIEAHADALDRFLALGGDDLEVRARAVCAGLGLDVALDRPVETLSGGQRARAALAAILLARFDVFLLDEPTNDLDFAGLDRLERFAADTKAALVIVSHDRAFMARTTDELLELEAETGRPRHYAGGYAEYERLRALAREREHAAWERYVDERRHFESLLGERRTQARALGGSLGKATGGADRRGTKALAGKVRQAERRLERLEDPGKPWHPWELKLELAPARRSGQVVLRLEGAVVERGRFRLGPLDLELHFRGRLAIVGPNGSGKTTLVDALLGQLPLTAGSRRVGPGVEFGVIDQERRRFAGAAPLLLEFRSAVGLPEETARTLLAKFGLGSDDVVRAGASLSPGERTRAELALVSARGANCLVLDEPTNHLDLEAIEQLEQALANFDGTLVVVSHDRRFLEGIAPSKNLSLT